jgi:outer membrane receptor for ferrienterochelin and colicins
MKKVLILFLLLSFQLASFTQTNLIIGTVNDAETSQALRDVEVYWQGKKDDEVRSDKFGVFEIEKTLGDSILIFEFPGKQIQTKNVIKDADYNELNVVLFDKGATSVTASRWEQSVNEIPASIIIITREEIEQQGYITLQEVLENVPGLFTMDHRSETDVTIGIRGFAGTFNRNVMIQVNGVSQLSERQNDFPLNKINIAVESIDKIEIVRGPMSVIYGAGAFFGVINIITNDSESGTNGLFSSSYGTQDAFRNVLRYAVNEKGLKLSLNAMHYQRNGFADRWSDMMNPGTDSIYHLSNTAFYEGRPDSINKERYSTKHYGINLSLDYEGFFARMNYAKSDRGFSFIHPGSQKRNDYVSNTFNSQFGYRGGTKNGNFDFEVRSGYYHSLVNASYNYLDALAYTPGDDKAASIRSEINTRTILFSKEKGNRFDMDLILGASHNWNLENSSLYNAAEFDLRNWYVGLAPNTSLHTWAAYAQLDLKIDDIIIKGKNIGNLQFIAGGRVEQQMSYQMQNIVNQDYSFGYIYDTLQSNTDSSLYINYGNSSVDGDNDSIWHINGSGEPPSGINVEEGFTEDVNDQNDSRNFIPRLAIIYALNTNGNTRHFFRGMYGEAIKQSAVVDNAFDVMWAFDSLNRTYLKPEKIKTLEFGYTLRNDTLKFEGNVNYFRNDLRQLVVRTAEQNSDGSYTPASRNSGQLLTNGLEFIGSKWFDIDMKSRKRLSIQTSLNASYQVTKALDTLGGKSMLVSFSPYLLAGFKVGARFGAFKMGTIYLGSINLGFSGNYVGEMKSDLVLDDAALVAVGDASPGYMRFSLNFRISDLRFGGNTSSGGMFINLKAANLANKSYLYPTFNNASWANQGILGRSRQLLFTLGYKF